MVRLSLGVYNTRDDIDALVEMLERIARLDFRGHYCRAADSGDYTPDGYEEAMSGHFSLAHAETGTARRGPNWSSFRSIRADHVDNPIVSSTGHLDAPGIAAHLAVLNEAALDVRLDVDFQLLAAKRTRDQELIRHVGQRSRYGFVDAERLRADGLAIEKDFRSVVTRRKPIGALQVELRRGGAPVRDLFLRLVDHPSGVRPPNARTCRSRSRRWRRTNRWCRRARTRWSSCRRSRRHSVFDRAESR